MNNVDVAQEAMIVKDEYGNLCLLEPCEVHKSYRGDVPPSSTCEHCCQLYAIKNR